MGIINTNVYIKKMGPTNNMKYLNEKKYVFLESFIFSFETTITSS
jgi:hypothetical protein